MKKATVLVTGASGFIGQHVITDLLKEGYAVIATSSSEARAAVQPWFRQVRYLPFDLGNFAPEVNYYEYFQRPDHMIHLAWEGLPQYKSLFHFEENLPRHYAFLKNMVTNGLTDLSVTGTCLEYGFHEGCLQEEMMTDPGNAYALAKDTLRKFLQQLQKVQPFSLKWIRLFYMFGKGQNPNSLFSQLDRAIERNEPAFNMSGGEQVRDYLPVADVAAYIRAIALQDQVTGLINCCSGQPVQLKDLVALYLQEKKSDISLNLGYYPYLDYEPMRFWGDNSRLQTILENEQSR
ncbi:NAD(P)-dependent oxidoreductase [Paraflavisolibacter sp. H34]|uniref:NAD-dependent epimerase/dehydratase family protein n=1 Tax=Huijunlia imazamoxiresistens TaxID=3127457 RepID=UPI003019CAC9